MVLKRCMQNYWCIHTFFLLFVHQHECISLRYIVALKVKCAPQWTKKLTVITCWGPCDLPTASLRKMHGHKPPKVPNDGCDMNVQSANQSSFPFRPMNTETPSNIVQAERSSEGSDQSTCLANVEIVSHYKCTVGQRSPPTFCISVSVSALVSFRACWIVTSQDVSLTTKFFPSYCWCIFLFWFHNL